MERDGPRRLWWVPVIAVAVLLALGLLVKLHWSPLLTVDGEVSDELVRPGRGSYVDLLRALTVGGELRLRLVVLVPLAVWLVVRRSWRVLVVVVAGALLVSALNRSLKWIFERPRPDYPRTMDFDGLSFPSGHSSGAAALAAVLLVAGWPALRRHVWRGLAAGLAVLLALVVGYTRIALGAHYLSDVVAGWSLGVGWVALLALLLLRPPGAVSTSPDAGEAAEPQTQQPIGRTS